MSEQSTAPRRLARGFEGAVLKLLRADDHEIRLTARRPLPGRMLRLSFASPTLFGAAPPFPSFWIRIWFPDPAAPGRAHQRAYTVLNADPEAGTFDVDFLVHEPAGPASGWAGTAEPGEVLAATVYGSKEYPTGPGRRHVLLADLASLPAARDVAAALAADGAEARVHIVLLPAEDWRGAPDGRPETDGMERADVAWTIDRGTGDELAAAAGPDLAWADAVWIAGESGRIRTLRRAVKENTSLGRKDVHALAYWASGRAMGRSSSEAG
ncbi:siderophore-interacting protein [Zafaria sp. Z1313]|uniref:siderophore-interacting protein n=1 Tax=Zafaria sp. Z1313 TaxID=3423202 RepID=UPI003D303C16